MTKRNNKSGKRLRLTPLILGGYGMFLGSGLLFVGLSEIMEGIGMIRALLGLGMVCFGVYGIWDGVRDLVKPNKRSEQVSVSQFIFTDASGKKTSLVTPGLIQEQLDILAKSEDYKSLSFQPLPPLSVKEHGLLKQVSCIYHKNMILVAFFEMPKDGYRVCQKSMEPDMAREWLERLLAGSPDFSDWEHVEADVHRDEEVPGYRHQLLIIFGESWHDEHKFFSSKDLELAIEGIHSGKYQKAILEWGRETFHIFTGQQNDLMVIWCKSNIAEKEMSRFLAREGTVTQVRFWVASYLERGFLVEMSGWSDITDQIEKAVKKGKRKYGNLF